MVCSGGIMAEQESAAAAKPESAADKAHQPAAEKPHSPPLAHKKKADKKPAPPARNPAEQWVDAYLLATLGELQPKKFVGSMEVTEFIPQIRLALRRKQPPLLGSLGRALVGVLLGLGGGAATWKGLGPGVPRTVGLALFALAFGFSVYRLLRPPMARWQVDTMTNRVQWWMTRGAAREIALAGCQSIDLLERRGLGGFRYRMVVEPRWGSTIAVASTASGARAQALLNALELVRAMVNVLRLPVRVRLSRLAGTKLELPPLPQAEPVAAVAGEDEPSTAAGS